MARRKQFVDFQPKSEWKEEDSANILILDLPDFKKEQLKITYVYNRRVLKVFGERPIADNKWNRFDQSFPVPQNCDVNKIKGNFQNGVLTITMPKLTNTQPAIPPKSVSVDEKIEKKETPKISQGAKTEDRRQKGIEETTQAQKPTPNGKQMEFEESSKAQKPIVDGKQVEARAFSPKEDMKNEMKQKDEKGYNQNSTKMKEKSEEENNKKRKEHLLGESEDISKKRKEYNGASEEMLGEKVKKLAADAKNRVKGLAMEISEERKSLLNIGVAVLVIAAFGAYISYRYGSSRSSKD